jgi:hypothetical protein
MGSVAAQLITASAIRHCSMVGGGEASAPDRWMSNVTSCPNA